MNPFINPNLVYSHTCYMAVVNYLIVTSGAQWSSDELVVLLFRSPLRKRKPSVFNSKECGGKKSPQRSICRFAPQYKHMQLAGVCSTLSERLKLSSLIPFRRIYFQRFTRDGKWIK
jgi:hypothetical protein